MLQTCIGGVTPMDKWITNLNNIQKKYGFPLHQIKEYTVRLSQMTILDRKNTHFYEGEIQGNHIVIMAVDEINIKRIRNLISKLEDTLNDQTEIVLVLTQVTKADRKQLLNGLISFITLDGEFFLPKLNIKLLPVSPLTESSEIPLTIMGQKLFILLVMDMINQEKSIDKNDLSYVENGFYKFKGGSIFIEKIGKAIGINNRVSFNRAITDLIKHGLIKTVGETNDKQYYADLNSKVFFKTGERYLQSPIKNQELLIKYDDNSIKTFTDGTLISGNSALNQVTMISYDGPKTYVVNKDSSKLISEKYQNTLVNSNENHDSPNKNIIIFQTEKYNLNFFNKMFRQCSKYPTKIVDPLHLYLMFLNSNDDRVLGEVEELLNSIWR